MTKICLNCGIEKPLNSFYFAKAKQNKNGFRGVCKECDKIYRCKYNEENKERLLTQKKHYRDTHKEEKSIQDKNYRIKNWLNSQ
jgi:hypothetical protein